MRPKELQLITQADGSGAGRAILIFAGWGMDSAPFAGISKPGYDIWLAYEYESGEPQLDQPLAGYDEVVVAAWSFGVRAAADFLRNTSLPITRTIAVNGTEAHIHDTKGIPRAIFNGTLEGLSERTLMKFRRRMCGSSATYEEFMSHAPGRSLESLRAELEAFADAEPIEEPYAWSCATVGGNDMIFPADNQLRAWAGVPVTINPDGAHLPDLQEVLDRFVVDKELVAERFSHAQATYGDNAEVQRRCARRLWDATAAYLPAGGAIDRIVEIGAGSGILTRQYVDKLKYNRLELRDIATLNPGDFPAGTVIAQGDAETAMATGDTPEIDLLLSASTIQWFNSPERFIGNAAGHLRCGGIMSLAYFTEGTCREISDATGVSLPYPDHRRLCEAARRSGLEILHESTERVEVKFASPIEALRHLQHTGVNALRRNGRAGTAARKVLDSYPREADGSCSITYSTAYIIAKKR